ncbi:hypothetical protein CBW16_08125 [Flavobacteriaceae bacterium JJC]|nr:hypothetical protein CBW16_08125 [Flavobacteriaceae bacterium JJC]
MKKNIFLAILSVLLSLPLYAQTGYIYVHKKAVSEVSSLDFAFNLTGPSSFSRSFSLNDQPDALNAFDLGNSHGAGEGQLWAVINNASQVGSTHVTDGTLYTRPVNSQVWAAKNTGVTNVRSVDGIDANTAVYCNSTGTVYTYNAVTNVATSIGSPANIIDVASGGPGGVIVAVGSNGTLYKYSSGTSWSAYTGSNVSNVLRVDVNPTNQDIVFIRTTNQSVYRLPGGSAFNAAPTVISAPSGTTSAGDDLRDIAVSNNGTIYSNFQNAGNSANIYEYTSAWADNATSRSFSGITAGVGTQSWAINKVNPDQIKHSIFTSTVLSTSSAPGLWLDDERVRTVVTNGNSIMIPVPAGTYALTETNDPAWASSEIKIYDPTTNSSSATAINVAAGEVVHVVYTNSLKNTVTTPAICGTNRIVTFGSGTAATGPASNGFTSYHYAIPNGGVSDGYYSKVKSKANWYNNSPALTDHTGDLNGYFGIFNASYATDDFFRQTVDGLVPGTLYEFAFWVADLSPTNPIRPNVTMGINDAVTGALISSTTTGDVTSSTWIQYKFNFVATSTVAEIFLKNNSIGGLGNDLAIDDISFAPAPPVVVTPEGPVGITLFCNNPATVYQFTSVTPGGVWSTDTPALISINASGLVTTKTGVSGTANVNYTVTSSSGCSTTVTLHITIAACICYNNPATGTGADTKTGITLLKRAGADSDNWPMIRKSAHTALESNTKGFVITRMTTAQILAIVSPQEGMMVYDTVAKCLKINSDGTSSGWSCFNNPACP